MCYDINMNKILLYGLISCAVIIATASIWFLFDIPASQNNAITITHNLHDYEVTITKNQSTIRKNDAVSFSFTVKRNGVPAQLLEHKIYPHASVTSSNLRDIAFYHVDNLKLLENDTYEFSHQFTTTGDYTIWIELNNNTTVANHHAQFSDYIGNIPVNVTGTAEPIAKQSLTATDKQYQLQLIPDQMKVGAPSTFRIVVTTKEGTPVKLLKDVDHFYYTANPIEHFYQLDHPDLPLTKDNEVTISNVTYPSHGQYAFWIRLFPDDGTGKPHNHIQGSFVLPQL